MRLLRRVWAFPLFSAHKQKEKRNRKSDSFSLAPQVGLEPTTLSGCGAQHLPAAVNRLAIC